MSRNRINLVLVLLVTCLGALVWLSGADKPQTQATKLTQMLPDQIDNIRISNHNGPTFSMRRERESWRMTEPYAIEVDDVRVRRLLDILASPVHTRFEPEQGNLAEFGLTPPAAVVELNQLEIRIGGTDPIAHRRYIGIGKMLYLIKDLYPHLLLAPAESFVSRKIVPHAAELELIQTPDWKLARTPNATRVWQLTPAATDISMDRLTAKVDEWKNAQALKVVRAPAVAADSRIEIQLKGSESAISFGILRQPQGMLLLREDLGIGYDLPGIGSLISVPAEAY